MSVEHRECPELAAALMWDGKHPSGVSCTPTLAQHTESCCPSPAWPALYVLVALGPWHGAVPVSVSSWAQGTGHGAQLPVTESWEPVLLSSVLLGPLSALWEEIWINHITVAWRRGHKSFWRGKKATSGHCWNMNFHMYPVRKNEFHVGKLIDMFGHSSQTGRATNTPVTPSRCSPFNNYPSAPGWLAAPWTSWAGGMTAAEGHWQVWQRWKYSGKWNKFWVFWVICH